MNKGEEKKSYLFKITLRLFNEYLQYFAYIAPKNMTFEKIQYITV